MSQETRRSIDEFITLYELEPRLRDVFVEGVYDKRLVQWFITEKGFTDVVVREIDVVDVPADVLERYGLKSGNRSRVIAFALSVYSYFNRDVHQISCIVDTDFDFVLGKDYSCPILLRTDYSSMESYFFNIRTLNKFFHMFCRGFSKPANEVIDIFAPVLHTLFAFRFINISSDLSLTWLTPERCYSLVANQLHFNHDDFLSRWLNRNSKLSIKNFILQKYTEVSLLIKGDMRHFIHEHDLINLLSWYLKRHTNQNELTNPEVILSVVV